MDDYSVSRRKESLTYVMIQMNHTPVHPPAPPGRSRHLRPSGRLRTGAPQIQETKLGAPYAGLDLLPSPALGSLWIPPSPPPPGCCSCPPRPRRCRRSPPCTWALTPPPTGERKETALLPGQEVVEEASARSGGWGFREQSHFRGGLWAVCLQVQAPASDQ